MTQENANTDTRPESIDLTGTAVGTIEADDVVMHESAGGLVVASEGVTMNHSGAGCVVSDGETRTFQSGCGVLLTNEADVTDGIVGVLVARDAKIGGETKVLATWVEAVVFGVVFGVVAACVDLAFRGVCRRR